MSKKMMSTDHTPQLHRLNRIKGQVEGIERMIMERRYCPEIIQQLKATRSAIKSLEVLIFEGHMRHCVHSAVESKDKKTIENKLKEIVEIMKGQMS